MRTVLIVAGEFPPVKTIGRLRTVKFIEHLHEHGWRSIVLTVEPNGTTAVRDPDLEAEVPADTPVYRAPLPDLEASLARTVKAMLGRGEARPGSESRTGIGAQPDQRPAAASPESSGLGGWAAAPLALFKAFLRHGVYVPDSYNLWAWHASRLGRRILAEHRIDLVYASLPPFSAAFVGRGLARSAGVPWVVDYRDLWTGDVLREWLGPVRSRLELRLERHLMQAADAVVSVSEPKTDYLRRLHKGGRARWVTVTNGWDPEEFEGFRRSRPQEPGTVRFVFTGRLFKNRRGYAFVEALGRIRRERPDLAARASVHMVGGIAPEIRRRYDELIAEHDLGGRFVFHGDIPHRAAKQAQVDTDWLLLIVDTGPTSDGVIPGKLFEYVAAKRPIFALTDPGATADIIERGRLGRVVPAEDTDACETALREVLADPTMAERWQSDRNYLAQFNRRELTKQLAGLFDSLCRHERAAPMTTDGVR